MGGSMRGTVRAAVASLFGLATHLAAQADIGPPPGRLVDVGGRKLHAICSGSGGPTVVLEAGASAFAIDWTLVQREVARTTRVCAYDRAGSGWSDPPGPAANASVPRDLHTMLTSLGERPPYVMAGASRGGMYARAYHADYPDEVAGFVLVDPASEDRMWTHFQGNAVLIGSLTAEQQRSLNPRQPVAVPRRRPQTGAPFDKLPPPLYDLRVRLDMKLIASVPDTVSPEAVAAFRENERAELARLLEQRSKDPHPLGDLPTVVLSRGVESPADLQESHAGLARLSTNSRHAVVAGAGHEIHLFEPAAVVQAIQDVVTAVRGKGKLRSDVRSSEVQGQSAGAPAPTYSDRSARLGSAVAARRAGPMHAATADTSSTPATTPSTTGSRADCRKRSG
jgi:pimeloyl-ACP methyl ester carboxylesterase